MSLLKTLLRQKHNCKVISLLENISWELFWAALTSQKVPIFLSLSKVPYRHVQERVYLPRIAKYINCFWEIEHPMPQYWSIEGRSQFHYTQCLPPERVIWCTECAKALKIKQVKLRLTMTSRGKTVLSKTFFNWVFLNC